MFLDGGANLKTELMIQKIESRITYFSTLRCGIRLLVTQLG